MSSIITNALMCRQQTLIFFSLFFLALANSANGDYFSLSNIEEGVKGDIWALLIAGSSGWGNYRHQADVCHAFQVLKQGGVPDDHIVVMMADDIAMDSMNPHPGAIFNKPGGPNVYEGVPKDYTGSDVTTDIFLAALAGKSLPAVVGSSGKIIKSGPDDRIFLFYADHGAPGVVGMPNGEFLYADQLMKVLQEKADAKEFADMVIYIEACESGSMFEGLLPNNISIYATTAANAYESSWGTYCPGTPSAPPPEFNTCLGDLYSVAWMENSDSTDLNKETLEVQYEVVKDRTSVGGSYNQGSHVLQFGTLSIDDEPAADYLGMKNDGTVHSGEELARAGVGTPHGGFPQREADLVPLRTNLERASDPEAKAAAQAALAAELGRRAALDRNIRKVVAALLRHETSSEFNAEQQPWELVKAKYGVSLVGNETLEAAAGSEAVESLVSTPWPRPAGAALVDDWDCLRGMVAAWELSCGRLGQYGMQYTRTFANLCNAGVNPGSISDGVAIVRAAETAWPAVDAGGQYSESDYADAYEPAEADGEYYFGDYKKTGDVKPFIQVVH